MIRNFKNGDIVTADHEGQFLTGRASTANGIRHRLLMFFGEYFLDVADGTPWFQSILGKSSQDLAEISIKQRVLSSKDVVGITEFSFDSNVELRSLSVRVGVVDINNEQVQSIIEEELF